MKFQTTTAYVIDDGKYVDAYYVNSCPRYESMFACWVVTNRPCGNFWTGKRFSTRQEWIAVLLAKGAKAVTL